MPNVGSLVKVNFNKREFEIAEDYAKVIIGLKQPIQGKFEPLYLV